MFVSVYLQIRCFIYRSGDALYRECSYIEEKAVYVINIHVKIVQWESWKKYCSIIKIDLFWFWMAYIAKYNLETNIYRIETITMHPAPRMTQKG